MHNKYTILSPYIQQYMKELSKYFLFIRKPERKFFRRLRKQMEEYAEDLPDSNYNTFVKQFGTPQEVATAYYRNVNGDILIKHLRIRRYLFGLIFFILLLVLSISVYSRILLQKSIECGEEIEIQHYILPSIYNDTQNQGDE